MTDELSWGQQLTVMLPGGGRCGLSCRLSKRWSFGCIGRSSEETLTQVCSHLRDEWWACLKFDTAHEDLHSISFHFVIALCSCGAVTMQNTWCQVKQIQSAARLHQFDRNGKVASLFYFKWINKSIYPKPVYGLHRLNCSLFLRDFQKLFYYLPHLSLAAYENILLFPVLSSVFFS